MSKECPQHAHAQSSILGASDLTDQGWGPGLYPLFPDGSDVKPWLKSANLAYFSLKVFTAYPHGMWAQTV